ncbi:hypothetical protein DFR47_1197 [Pseudochrobactrum asaccharolyticum]|uniref:Uncharacterized protein n=1 Tax=Pseudochrobactrum asaccharolyticum TaxID=354351 RepID=A0A366DES0_9HYPH|nr:hypothetical protein DFR47_1197 [Pseudochrobactrum asaccharolyticum]
MTKDQREIRRKLRIQKWLGLSEQFGRVVKWISAAIMLPPLLVSAC